MPTHGLNNVIRFPTAGQAIQLHDEGIYYAVNARTGEIQHVLQLVQADDWCLFQLDNSLHEEDVTWSLLSADADYTLKVMMPTEISQYFAKPEYAEPKGTWHAMKNATFGFGKFTPLQLGEPVRYALLRFNNAQMHMPILLHRADDIVEVTEALSHQKMVNHATREFEWRK